MCQSHAYALILTFSHASLCMFMYANVMDLTRAIPGPLAHTGTLANWHTSQFIIITTRVINLSRPGASSLLQSA